MYDMENTADPPSVTYHNATQEPSPGFTTVALPSFSDNVGPTEPKQNHVDRPYDFCLQSAEVSENSLRNWQSAELQCHSESSKRPVLLNCLHSNGSDSTLSADSNFQPNCTEQSLVDFPLNLNGSSSAPDNVSVNSSSVLINNEISRNLSSAFLINEFNTESQDSTSQDARAHSFLRKELLAALSHDADNDTRRTATPETDTLSMATTASFEMETAEDDINAKPTVTPTKVKQGRRTKKWLDDSDKEPLSYELKIGVRILGEFMVEANKSLTWPFMNQVDAERDGVPDYYDVIKQPVWFNKMKEKFVNREYQGIDEFVSDFRTMLQNCYRYNGPDHPISKKAQRLETMLEQKLSLLSRELREKIEKFSVAGSAISEKVSGSRRRRQIVPHDSTALLNKLRLEQIEREKEARKVHMEEKKLQQEAYLRGIDDWEMQLFTEHERKQIKSMYQLPQIGHFLFLCQGPLNIGETAQFELERSFLMPKESLTMQKVMTSLLSTPYQRARLGKKPYMPYSVWEEKLRVKSRIWYKVLRETGLDVVKAAEKLGIEETFFKVLGLKNPLEKRKFHELTFYQRVWIVKNLCDWCLENQESLREAIEAQPSVEQHEYVLGEDTKGYTYIHFPQFCGADLRVYRHAPIEMPTLDIPQTSPAKKAKKIKTRLSARWAAARKRLLTAQAKLRIASPASSQSEPKQSPRKYAYKPRSRDSSESSTSSFTDSGISDSDSDFQPKQSRSKRSARARSKPKPERKGRKQSPQSSTNVSRDSTPCRSNRDSTPNRNRDSSKLPTGRVTRSAWKKCIEVSEEKSTPTHSSKKKKSRASRSARRAVSKRKPPQNEDTNDSITNQDNEIDQSVDIAQNDENEITDTHNLPDNQIGNNEMETVDSKPRGSSEKHKADISCADSETEEEMDTKTTDVKALDYVKKDLNNKLEEKSDRSLSCDKTTSHISDIGQNSVVSHGSTNAISHGDSVEANKNVNGDPVKEPCADQDQPEPANADGTGNSAELASAANERRGTQNVDVVLNQNDQEGNAETSGENITVEASEEACLDTSSVKKLDGDILKNDFGKRAENSVEFCRSDEIGRNSDNTEKVIDEINKSRSDVTSENSVSETLTPYTEIKESDNFHSNSSSQMDVDPVPESANKCEEKQTPENEDDRNEIAQTMISLSNTAELPKNINNTRNNNEETSPSKDEKLENGETDSNCDQLGNEMKYENVKIEKQEENIIKSDEIKTVEEKTEAGQLVEKKEVKEETKDGSSGKVKEEEVESELDEPEIKDPEFSEFELICETVEELRVLTQQFTEQMDTPNTRSDKKRKPTQSCEQELYGRLAFLLKELEPWESKLLQANRRMKVKMKREQENYVEETVKDDDVWESEPSSESSDDGGNDDDSSPEYVSEAVDKMPALRPRRKKTVTPTPDDTKDIYMDQIEEYGYSSMGRKRKRRIIPNNAEDQGVPKKTKPARTQKKVEVPKSAPSRTPKSAASSSQTQTTARSSHSQSKMQHLIFQQSDGRRFTISDNQTLLLRAPSATPGGPTQLIQIPGSVAIKNPGLLSQFLSSGKLGPGTAAILYQNQDAPNTAEVLKQHLSKKNNENSAQAKNQSESTFPAFQFKSSATPNSANNTTQRSHKFHNVSPEMMSTKASAVEASPEMVSKNVAGATSTVTPSKAKHSPRILISPKASSADKPVQYAQVSPQLINQLPANVLAQLGLLKHQSGLQNQQAALQSPPAVIQNQTALIQNQPTGLQNLTAGLQNQATLVQNPLAVNIQNQPVIVQASGSNQPQSSTQISPSTQNTAGVLHSPPSASAKINRGFQQQFLALSGAKNDVSPVIPGSVTSPNDGNVTSQINPVQANVQAQQRPKYSSNVTVKELLERQLAGNVTNESTSEVNGQGDVEKLRSPTLKSPKNTMVMQFNAGDVSANTNALKQEKNPQLSRELELLSQDKPHVKPFERSDTREAAEALISLEAGEPKKVAESTLLASIQKVHIDVGNTNLSPEANRVQPQNQSSNVTPKNTTVQKIAVLAKTPQGAQSIKMLSADKLQKLIARKEAIDNAVKQVITEVPTTLPTVQIKVSSPFALTTRQKSRPCTAATMALKHPIPAVPPVPALTQSRSNTSVSASVGYDVTPQASNVITNTVVTSPSKITKSNLEALPSVATAPTALVSVKTTPLIHSTEASRVNPTTDRTVISQAGTVKLGIKPQTVQVLASAKETTASISQTETSSKPANVILQQGSTSKNISPKGFNVAKLKEQGLVLVKTANGQLQIMKASQVATLPRFSAANNPAGSAFDANQGAGSSSTSHVLSSSGQKGPTNPAAAQLQNSENIMKSPPKLIQPKLVAVNQSQLQKTQVAQQPTLVLQSGDQVKVANQGQANISHIQTGVSQARQAVGQIQQPRLVLQPSNQIQAPAVSQVQQVAGAVNQLQQPRLVLVNVNGQLMAQAVPQVNLSGGMQLMNNNGALVQQLVQQSPTNLVQPGIQLASQPVTLTNQASVANLQIPQQPSLNIMRPVLVQGAGLQTPVAMVQGGIQGQIMVPSANIQGSVAMLQASGVQSGVLPGQVLQMPVGVIQQPVVSSPVPTSQVMVNLNNVFQTQTPQ